MNEQLQSKLVEVIAAIQSGVGKSADFALTQLPDIAQQYVTYGRAWSIVSILLCVVVLGLYYALVRRAACYSGTDGGELVIASAALGAPLAVLVAIYLFLSIKTAAIVWAAPKVWLIQELAGLLK